LKTRWWGRRHCPTWARILEKVIAKVSDDLDTEWAKAEATRKEYLDKIKAHTTCVMHSLNLNKMMGEK
jgi:hypothetical protein